MAFSQTLFAFDSDTPTVRMYRSDRKYVGKINPVTECRKWMAKVNTGGTYYIQKQNEKEAQRHKSTEKDLDEHRGHILAMAYMDSSKQVVFSYSRNYLIFFDAISDFTEEENINVLGYVKAEYAQIGMMYSPSLDMLITWPGEASDHYFNIWDPTAHTLRFKIKKHEYKVLSVCEVILDSQHPSNTHFIASSSIDKKLILWPTAPLSNLSERSSKMLRMSDTMEYELRGHTHAICSLAYAEEHEMLFGAGFDYEIFGWDPYTRDICMKFVGHFKSIVSIQLAMIPSEKLVSIDETGVMKVWNIDKDLGLFAEQLQSVRLESPQTPLVIYDFSTAFRSGQTIAILAERLYFMVVEGDALDDLRPVRGGLGVTERAGRMWSITRNTINLINMADGTVIKRLAFLDQDRISSNDVIRSSDGDVMHSNKISSKSKKEILGKALSQTLPSQVFSDSLEEDRPQSTPIAPSKNVSYLDEGDTITAVTADTLGKRVFIGTMDGRVLLFDSYTFGLLLQLTDEEDDKAFKTQGFVSGLQFVQRDELLVACYSNGAVKVFVGCHRQNTKSSTVDQSKEKRQALHKMVLATANLPASRRHRGSEGLKPKVDTSAQDEEIDYDYPVGGGGKAPNKPFLLREVDLGLVTDNSVNSLSVSEGQYLIATGSKDGYISIFDYLTMDLVSMLKVPKYEGINVFCTDIQFLPLAPIIVCLDSVGRASAWSVRPLKFQWLYTWSVYHEVKYQECADGPLGAWGHRQAEQGDSKIHYTTDLHVQRSGMQLTCLKCIYYTELIPPSEQKLMGTAAEKKPAPFKAVEKRQTMMRRSSSAVNLRTQVNRTRGTVMRKMNVRDSMQLKFNQGFFHLEANTDQVDEKAEDTSSLLTFSIPTQKGAGLTTEEKILGGSVGHREIVQYRRKWLVLIGDEGGNMMLQDLSRLVEKSGATRHLPKMGIHLPVYQRQNPKRLNPSGALHRLHNPGNSQSRPLSGIRNQTPLARTPLQATRGSDARKDTPSEEFLPPSSSRGKSQNTKGTVEIQISDSLLFNIENPVGSEINVELSDAIHEAKIMKYVVGLRRWIAYPGEPVRGITLTSNSPAVVPINVAFPQVSSELASEEPHKDLFPDIPDSPYGSNQSYSGLSLDKRSLGVPLLHTSSVVMAPEGIVSSSELGAVRMWNWQGQYLGTTREENPNAPTIINPALLLESKGTPEEMKSAILEQQSSVMDENPIVALQTSTHITTTTVSLLPKEGETGSHHKKNLTVGLTLVSPTDVFGLQQTSLPEKPSESAGKKPNSKAVKKKAETPEDLPLTPYQRMQRETFQTSLKEMTKRRGSVFQINSVEAVGQNAYKALAAEITKSLRPQTAEAVVEAPINKSNMSAVKQEQLKRMMTLTSKTKVIVSHCPAVPMKKGHKGWRYPVVSVYIGSGGNFAGLGRSMHAYHRLAQHYTLLQYHYYNGIISWVIPLLRTCHIPRLDTKKRPNTAPHTKFNSVSSNITSFTGDNSDTFEKAYHRRFQSSENLLNTISSPSAGSSLPQPYKARMDSMPSMNEASDKSGFDLGDIKPTSTEMNEQQLASEELNQEFIAKFRRTNMMELIDYIQDSRYFNSTLKHSASSSLRCHNLEREKDRLKTRHKLDGKGGKPLRGHAGNIIPFDRTNITGDLQPTASTIAIAPNLQANFDQNPQDPDPRTMDITFLTTVETQPGEPPLTINVPTSPSTQKLRPKTAPTLKSENSQQRLVSVKDRTTTSMQQRRLSQQPVQAANTDSCAKIDRIIESINEIHSTPVTGPILIGVRGIEYTPKQSGNNTPNHETSPRGRRPQSADVAGKRSKSSSPVNEHPKRDSRSIASEVDGQNPGGTLNKTPFAALPEINQSHSPVAEVKTVRNKKFSKAVRTVSAVRSFLPSPKKEEVELSETEKALESFLIENTDLIYPAGEEKAPVTADVLNMHRLEMITMKFDRHMRLDKEDRKVHASFNPVGRKKASVKKARQKKIQILKMKRQNNDYVNPSEFADIIDVEKEFLKAERKKLAKTAAGLLDRGLYGPYRPKYLFLFLQWLCPLEELAIAEGYYMASESTNRGYDDNMDATKISSGDGETGGHLASNKLIFKSQSKYAIRCLLNDNGTPLNGIFVSELEEFSKKYIYSAIDESVLVQVLFQQAERIELTRIYLFLKLAKMFYSLLRSATVPKDAIMGVNKALTDKQRATVAIIKNQQRETIEARKNSARLTKISKKMSVSAPTGFVNNKRLSMMLNDDSSSSSSEDSEENRRLLHMSELVSRPMQRRGNTVSQPAGFNFVVRPHPNRCFRHWVIRKKAFNKILKFLDAWNDSDEDGLTLQEFVDIFQSMVPRSELEKYRTLRGLESILTRIGYKMNSELTSELVTTLFENVFEIKIENSD